MKPIFILDSFQRGGLEKSCVHLSKILSKSSISIIIWSLYSSKPFINDAISLFPDNVEVKYFSNRFSLYCSYVRLPNSSLCISFKNHLAFILLKVLFRLRIMLIIRHSNTILFDIIRPSYSNKRYLKSQPLGLILGFASKLSSYLKLFIITTIYSANRFHVCNSIENKMLLQLFLKQNVFCYVNPDILSFNPPKVLNNTQVSRIELLWASRYAPSKDISTLIDCLLRLQLSSNNNSYLLTAYTTKPDQLLSDFTSAGLHPDSFRIHSWSNYQRSSSDIYIHTAYHEGLSNSFMEQIFQSRRIVCPLTSSGFLEFACLLDWVYFYRPSDSNDLFHSLKSAIGSLSEEVHPYSSPSIKKYLRLNQQFLDFLKSYSL